ncbi:MAG: hypothetical protein ACR2OG_07115 [Gemmatimonadaceae bacterium]
MTGGTASVEGDIYLVTKSADIKRGVANEVALIPVGASVGQKWRLLCDQQASEDAAWKASTDSVASSLTDIPAKIAYLKGNIRRISESVDRRRLARVAMLKSAALALSPTGVNAHYRFDRVPPGNYGLFAEMVLDDTPYHWYYRVVLRPGDAQHVDLDNSRLLDGHFSCDDLPAP